MDGESLYRQYLSGEKTAFDGIVELYRENLIFFINRYTGDLDAAEDLSQDAFLELRTQQSLQLSEKAGENCVFR